jgi:diadenosine tetraphosphate (Ap4A) HIT family hydrolase
MSLDCPFCNQDNFQILFENEFVFTLRDAFPISPGHTLIIPKRHIASFFDTTENEQQALFQTLQIEKSNLEQKYIPSGYNIGINDGLAAGQTVMHLHIHLIPRYTGDCDDPRGGVRWLFPNKAIYWE